MNLVRLASEIVTRCPNCGGDYHETNFKIMKNTPHSFKSCDNFNLAEFLINLTRR